MAWKEFEGARWHRVWWKLSDYLNFWFVFGFDLSLCVVRLFLFVDLRTILICFVCRIRSRCLCEEY